MAVVYELVVDPGTPAVERALIAAVGRTRSLRAGGHEVTLRVSTADVVGLDGTPRREVAVIPRNVGIAVVGDDGELALTSEELVELADGLYTLLRAAPGHVGAIVGWDPEAALDPAERAVAGALPPGLVLPLSAWDLHPDVDVEPFAPGYLRTPPARPWAPRSAAVSHDAGPAGARTARTSPPAGDAQGR